MVELEREMSFLGELYPSVATTADVVVLVYLGLHDVPNLVHHFQAVETAFVTCVQHCVLPQFGLPGQAVLWTWGTQRGGVGAAGRRLSGRVGVTLPSLRGCVAPLASPTRVKLGVRRRAGV